VKSNTPSSFPNSNAVSRLQLQSPGHRNQPPTSNIKELHLKPRITQVVYLQSMSIKVHTICNRTLIVRIPPHKLVTPTWCDCCDCSSPWNYCLSGCCLDTDLHKRYLVTEVLNMWEVSMGGSHTSIYKNNPRNKEANSGQKSQSGLDTKTYWLTDRQPQGDCDWLRRAIFQGMHRQWTHLVLHRDKW
jgi:hypothetical protein